MARIVRRVVRGSGTIEDAGNGDARTEADDSRVAELGDGIGGGGDGGSGGIVNPADFSGTGDEELTPTGRKKRKTGPRKPRESKSVQATLNGVAAMLVTITGVAAAAVKIPELALNEFEANGFADASVKLMDHYGVTGMGETAQLWFNFAVVSGTIAVGHFAAYKARMSHA